MNEKNNDDILEITDEFLVVKDEKKVRKPQTIWEVRADWISHGFAFIFAIVASVLLIVKASAEGDARWILSTIAYAISLMFMFLASTVFHFVKSEKRKKRWHKFDHMAIYLLILGSHTPIIWIAIQTTLSYVVWWVLLGLTITGMIFKIFYAGRFVIASTLIFILMGWSSLTFITQIYDFNVTALVLLIVGGLCYTFGAFVYAFAKFKYQHFIWHLFIIAGAVIHFVCIYWFVLNVDLYHIFATLV